MSQSSQMTSRERLLRALDRQPVDRVPLLFRFWSMGGDEHQIPFDWRDEVTRVEHTLALGLDDTLTLQPPLGYVEDYVPEALAGITSHTERLPAADGEPYPRLRKVYETPAGPLQTVIALDDGWEGGDDIRLFDDHNIPRIREPLIKTRDDLPKLKCLLGQPSADQIAAFRQRAAVLNAASARLGVLLDGGWLALGDAITWLCGMERVLYGQMDDPDFLAGVLEVIAAWELGRLEHLLEADVDVIVHMAWYETSDFWTPANYRRLLKPHLRREVERVHRAGKKYRYIITKAWKPFIPDFLELGIDCLMGVDPVQDTIDLGEAKRALGDRMCLMGGMNSAVMFSQWSDAQIRQAAADAVRILAPGGGFIGYPVDAIFNTTPWDKVEVLLETWRALNA